MRTYGIVCVLVALGLLSGPAMSEEPVQATPTKTPALDEFRVLIDRNIFDANRGNPSALASQEESPPPKTLRLMGTWFEGDRALALFEEIPEGTQTTLERGGAIAGYAVADIGAQQVVLRNDQGTLELPVGSGLVKEEDGDWTVVDSVMPAEAPVSSADDGIETLWETQSTADSANFFGDTGSEDRPFKRRKHPRKERE